MGSAAIRLVRSGIWWLGGKFAVEAVGGGGEGAAGDGGGAEIAAELVDGLVELAGAVALFVGEEGELLGLAVGEVTEGDAEQAEGAAVPEFGEEGFGAVIELLRDVAGLGEAALVGVVLKSLPRMVTVRQRQRRPSARRRAATLSHRGRAGPDWPAGRW